MPIASLARRLRVAGWPITCAACHGTYRADLAAAEASGRLTCGLCGHDVAMAGNFVDRLAFQLAGLPDDQLDEAFRRGI